MTTPLKGHTARAGLSGRAAEFFSEHFPKHRPGQGLLRNVQKRPLRVMKFGGTSVGDASCIERVVEIIRNAARDSDVVVVVSAMSGVTNQLVAAASQAEAGNCQTVAAIFEALRRQHDMAARALIHSTAERSRVEHKMTELLQAGDRLCQGTILLRELTPRTRDLISSLGERLSVPLVAAALAERGVNSEAIEATELVVTDECHGAADPCMDRTRERCEARLRPLLRQGKVPVVTGFIGATADGVLTTLGRGGSDYSATILGGVLDADEVIIWTDVDGLQTADPRLVPDACTIPEVSYREAAELAYFGAKVLHPKTLRAVVQCGVPLWIRNTFAPELPGTKITPAGPPNAGSPSVSGPNVGGVKALTSISDVAMITVGGPGLAGVQDVLGRTFRTTAAVRADLLLILQASSQNDLCLVIPSALAKSTVEALRHEFAHDLAHEPTEHITLDQTVAMVTAVGLKMRSVPGIVGRAFGALGREKVNIIAIAQGSSEFTVSFVVAKKDMNTALASLHWEFRLGSLSNRTPSEDENYYPHGEPAADRPSRQEQQTSAMINSSTEEYVKPSLSLDSAYSDVQANR
jgi:aspartokinase/homoserine dehydrogenase 1